MNKETLIKVGSKFIPLVLGLALFILGYTIALRLPITQILLLFLSPFGIFFIILMVLILIPDEDSGSGT
jgi:vacuolar-type H+-ATPase subunit I/STV1